MVRASNEYGDGSRRTAAHGGTNHRYCEKGASREPLSWPSPRYMYVGSFRACSEQCLYQCMWTVRLSCYRACSFSFSGLLGDSPILRALAHIPVIAGGGGDGDQQGLPDWLESLRGEKLSEKPPFILASNLPPVPAKLVKKIQAMEFINMRELLPDNIALSERLEALPRAALQQAHAQREIDSLLTWTGAFLMYVAVMNDAHPEKTKSLLAYMRSLVEEARRNEGFNWRRYDTIFRRNAGADKDKDWATLDHSLHAACLSVSAGKTEKGASMLCSLCAGADHSAAFCALKSLQQATTMPVPPPRSPPGGSSSPRVGPRICLSWNRGRCAFPGVCNFAHVCATCRGSHPAKDCADTPLDSAFKRPPLPSRRRPSDAH